MEASFVSICERIIYGSFYTLVFLTPLLVCPWTYELFEFPKMLFVYALTVIIAAAFIIKSLWGSRLALGGILNNVRENPLSLPIVFYLLSFTISTAFSIHSYTSIFGYYSRFHGGLLSLFCYIALFYIYVSELKNKVKKLPTTNYLLLITASLVSLYGILQHLGIDRDYWIQDSVQRVFSTLGQPNWLAAWLLMVLPLSWAFYFASQRLLPVTGYLLLSIALFAAFWFTYSLSGVLGFLFTVVLFITLSPKKTLLESKKKLSLLAIGYLLIVILNPGPFETRLRSLGESFSLVPRVLAAEPAPIPGGDTARIRKIVWRGALSLWQNSPKNILVGTGPETFAYAFLPFRPAELNQTSEWEFLYNKAHNEYLDILCGTGILGLGAYLFLVGKFLWWGIKKIQNSKFKIQSSELGAENSKNTKYEILNTRYLIPALLSGWVSLLVTNFFGFSTVSTALLFWLYPAICFSLFSEG